MGGEVIVAMRSEAVILLSGFLEGIHMDHSHIEIAQLVQQPVIDLSCYRVPFGDRKARVYGYVDLRTEPVA